jgi:MerR family transcriptional regulator, light-induced transcriptional regulator
VGLEALAVLLRHLGIRCRVLGARTTVPALMTAVQVTGAPVVVVVSHLHTGRQRAIEAIRAAH